MSALDTVPADHYSTAAASTAIEVRPTDLQQLFEEVHQSLMQRGLIPPAVQDEHEYLLRRNG